MPMLTLTVLYSYGHLGISSPFDIPCANVQICGAGPAASAASVLFGSLPGTERHSSPKHAQEVLSRDARAGQDCAQGRTLERAMIRDSEWRARSVRVLTQHRDMAPLPNHPEPETL